MVLRDISLIAITTSEQLDKIHIEEIDLKRNFQEMQLGRLLAKKQEFDSQPIGCNCNFFVYGYWPAIIIFVMNVFLTEL